MASDPYVGEVMLFAGNFAPRGWVECDGSVLPIALYANLFSLIGTTYGGDGLTTFAVPDLRGRCIISQGQGPGLTGRLIGQAVGSESVTLSLAQLPGHSHPTLASAAAADAPTLTQRLPALAESPVYAAATGTLAELAEGALTPRGDSQPHANRQPSLALTYCIAAEGAFPQQS